MTQRQQTCCFTGPRDIAPAVREMLFLRLKEQTAALAAEGIRFFGCGGALGFDELAARAVLSLRGALPAIRLILVLPCPDWDRPWPPEDRSRYAGLCRQADKVVAVSPAYRPGCMQQRNRYLVDNSSVCVYTGDALTGGTGYTVAYAQKQGLRLVQV